MSEIVMVYSLFPVVVSGVAQTWTGAPWSWIPGSVRDVTKLRAEVQIVAPGSLPNDGKVISDQRSLA